MSTTDHRPAAPTSEAQPESGGGFTGDTEVFTTRGPVSITDLSRGDRVYALNPSARLAKPKLLREKRPFDFEGELVAISGKRVDFRLHPAHRVLYATKNLPYPRFSTAQQAMTQEYHRFVNEWKTPTGGRLGRVDLTDLAEEFETRAVSDDHGHTFRAALPEGCEPSSRNSHTGYYFDAATFKRYQSKIESAADDVSVRHGWKQRTTPYLFAGDDFIEFIGWFVTEGSVHWREEKRTATIQIAQETEEYRHQIAALFERMGIDVNTRDRSFRFGSMLFGSLLERLCGLSSKTKRLPSFVWRLATDQQQLLLETLMRGDGNECGVYYTASDRLAADVLRLCTEVGVKPRYANRNGTWQLYLSQGRDGFRTSTNMSTVAATTTLYQLTVEDFDAVLAGRNGRFQWIGVSCVS